MAIALVTHISGFSSGGNGFTTSSTDTSGANLLTVVLSDLDGSTTLSDSKSNSWTKLNNPGGPPFTAIWYAKNPSVGTGHTFTATATSKFPALCMAAFSGCDTSSPFDQQTAGAGPSSPIQPGSVTPSVANEVIITGHAHDGAGTQLSVDSGFTITDHEPNHSNNYGAALAYLIETTATAQNPTWTLLSGETCFAVIATFKPSGGAAAAPFTEMDPFTMSGIAAMMR